MTLGIAIAGYLAALAAAFGAAYLGGRLQRSSDTEHLARQLQIDAAAKLIGTAGDFQVAYAHAWAPGTTPLTMTERQRPIFEAVFTLRSRAAAVGIVGPDELATIAGEIVRLVLDRGLATSFDVPLFGDISLAVERFEHQARSLRPVGK